MTRFEDEFDIRPVISNLLSQWKLIVLIAVLAAIGGLTFSLVQPRSYESIATIIATRSQLQLSLADQFTTVNETNDFRSRMDAFLTIANSRQIAQTVKNALNGQLPPAYNVTSLMNAVEISDSGDAIQIAAIAEDPNLAADIANTWATEVTQAINRAYSGEQPLSEIQGRLNEAEISYNEAQSELEKFIAENQISFLENQISAKESLLTSLANDQVSQMLFIHDRIQSMETLLIEAEALKEQFENGSSSNAGKAGDALALLFARANASGVIEEITSNQAVTSEQGTIIFYNPGLSLDVQLSDFDGLILDSERSIQEISDLIVLAEREKAKAEATLGALGESGSQDDTLELQLTVDSDLRELKSRLEQATARNLQLTSDRDLAWEAYQELLKKETEIITTADTNNEVVLASSALPAQQPLSRQTVIKTMIAGLVGLLVGIGVVLTVSWWRSDSSDSVDPNPKLE